MGVLDQITELKNKGFSEKQIINKLEEQEGISPKEITDAMSRSKIKSAVSDEGQGLEGMQPSIMSPKEEETGSSENYGLAAPRPSQATIQQRKGRSPSRPQTQEILPPQENAQELYPPQEDTQELYPLPLQYSDQSPLPQAQEEIYEGYENQSYENSYATDTDTMIEISEQVFAEKMKSVLQKIEEALEFKTLAESRITNLTQRLTRIESQIDNLQAAILEKVGAYGRGLEGIKKEMSMMQDSFGKVVGTLVDKESPSISPSQTSHTTKKTTIVSRSRTKKKVPGKISKKK